MRHWRRITIIAVVTMATAAACWAWWDATARSELDVPFTEIRVGMSRAEVEGLLGPPVDVPIEMIRRIVGFRAVDHPGLHALPRPLPVRLWWHDGRNRCLYVEFTGDTVWRAKLFARDWENRLDD